MAEDWIKMRTGIYRDPKVCIIADMMGRGNTELNRQLSDDNGGDVFISSNVMRNAIVGALVSVWGVMRHRGERIEDDLVVLIASVSVVDDIADLPGFGSAMEAVGWLEALRDPDVGIRFPRFFVSYNADPDESKREQNRIRQQRFRDKQRNVTVSLKSNPREEKRREEKSKDKDTPKPPKGDSYSGSFELFWQAFPKGRKTGKGNAWKSWKRTCEGSGGDDLRPAIIAAATEYAASPVGKGQYVKGPTPWLNGRCWEDDRQAWQDNGKPGKVPEADFERYKSEGGG